MTGRGKRRLAFTLVALLLGGLLATAFLRIGYYLSAPAGAPQAADIIVALGGDTGSRAALAARLYREGYAPLVLLTGIEYGSPEARETIVNWRQKFLVDSGVPVEAIRLDARSQNSWEEALNTRAFLEANGLSSAIVVSEPPHMRRLRWVWSQVFEGSGLRFHLVSAEASWWQPGRWWTSETGALYVIEESIKLVYYWLRYSGEL